MNFDMLNLKLVQNGDAFDVIINADNDFLEEFGFDFSGENIRNKYDNIQNFIKEKYPGINLGLGKIMLSGVLVGTFAIGGGAEGFSPALQSFSSTVTTQAAVPLKTIHTVKAGDTLWIISNQYGVDIDELRAENNLTTDTLDIGQTITIPSAYIDDETEETFNYTVKSGDTLWIVANRNSTTVDKIKELNNLTSENLSVGQQLILTANTGQTEEQTPNVTETEETFNYTVKSGDTLWLVANRNSTTTDKIKELNNLTSENLSVGQQLILPVNTGQTEEQTPNVTETEETFNYTVKSGDTLWIVANRNSTTVDKIKELNNLTSENLSVGQQLILPANTGQTAEQTPNVTETEQTFNYTVKSGDTLWLVANRNSTTIDKIKELNNLTSENLSVGQRLILPVIAVPTEVTTPTDIDYPGETTKPTDTTEPITIVGDQTKYIVQPGDTLWTIASKFGTTMDALKETNNLSSDYLSTGQTLIIVEDVVDTEALDKTLLENIKYFPLADGYSYYYTNDYAAAREWTPTGSTERKHEGNDIMAKKGTPVVAIADGKVSRYGWNGTGGYRLMIKMDGTTNSVYYAHLSQYAPNIKLGSTVKAGQVVGYVGSTGYGPEGTSDKFDPHLHIGIYTVADMSTTTNPFDYMRNVETTKISL